MADDFSNTSQKKKTNDAYKLNVTRLKRSWERLKHRQAFVPLRKARIYSINIVDDGNGGKKLQVLMSDGGKFSDGGEKRNLFHAMDRRRKHSFSRLMSLVDLARISGVDTVSSDLPPRVRRAFMRVYKRRVGKIVLKEQIVSKENKDEALNQEQQPVKRQSFKNNEIVQALLKKKQATL